MPICYQSLMLQSLCPGPYKASHLFLTTISLQHMYCGTVFASETYASAMHQSTTWHRDLINFRIPPDYLAESLSLYLSVTYTEPEATSYKELFHEILASINLRSRAGITAFNLTHRRSGCSVELCANEPSHRIFDCGDQLCSL